MGNTCSLLSGGRALRGAFASWVRSAVRRSGAVARSRRARRRPHRTELPLDAKFQGGAGYRYGGFGGRRIRRARSACGQKGGDDGRDFVRER